tara:strand:- start:120 stop:434 length:315 start_codon:yes stop_codon:yes gene_type:complete
MKVEFEDGYAKGFAVAVPDCFKNALNTGQFSAGDLLYSNKSAYEKVWSEALKDLQYSIEVSGITSDKVNYRILVPNFNQSKLVTKEVNEVSIEGFVDLLRAGIK